VNDDRIKALLGRRKITVLITDSGLGGISICAEIARGLKTHPIFPEVSLIYYNAWPEQDRGYNRLKNTAERVRVFDRALDGMMRFDPDLIMIACNTLSVLYPRTEFSRGARIPVIDIVGFGVNMIAENLAGAADSAVVILGTLTTIASGVHRSRLVARGIDPGRIVSQPCDQLATAIEQGPRSDTVREMIATFTAQAAEKLGETRAAVFAALCCTHFGYCGKMIGKALQDRVAGPVTVLNPNDAMAGFLFAAAGDRRYPETDLDVKVVSKIIWEDGKIASVSRLIRNVSIETAEALENYERIPTLFTF